MLRIFPSIFNFLKSSHTQVASCLLDGASKLLFYPIHFEMKADHYTVQMGGHLPCLTFLIFVYLKQICNVY